MLEAINTQVHLKDLTYLLPQKEVLFSPEISITEESWEDISRYLLENIKREEGLSKLLTPATAVHILDSKKLEQLGIKQQLKEKFITSLHAERKSIIEDNRYLWWDQILIYAAKYKIVFPEYMDELFSQEILEEDLPKMLWLKSTDLLYLLDTMFFTILFNRYTHSSSIDDVFNLGLKTLTKTKSRNEWKSFIDTAVNLRFLLPHQFDQVAISESDWNSITKLLAIYKTYNLLEEYLDNYAKVKILSAKYFSLTNNGFSLEPQSEEPLFKSSTLPLRRKF